jgi:transcriptional regulator with XRE-family HTH domain
MSMTDVETTFAMRLRQYREANGWTQMQLANKVSVFAGRPVDQATIARIEKGTRHISLDDAIHLANALSMRIEDLLVAVKCDTCKDLPPVGFICQACGASREAN